MGLYPPFDVSYFISENLILLGSTTKKHYSPTAICGYLSCCWPPGGPENLQHDDESGI